MKPSPPEDEPDVRGRGFPQILHDRAREVGRDLFKLLLSLSTAILGIYFFALTAEVKPPLTPSQQGTALVALVLLAIAVLAGLIGLHADSRRNYFWASALQSTDRDRRHTMYKRRDAWMKLELRSSGILIVGFIGGLIASVIYTALRLVGT